MVSRLNDETGKLPVCWAGIPALTSLPLAMNANQEEEKVGTAKEEIAEATKLSQAAIMRLVERVLGKHRGDPLPVRNKAEAVGRFLMAMQTAIGDGVGWQEGKRILLHAAPDEAVEVTLSRHALKYPASIRKGQFKKEEKMNTENNNVAEEEATATATRTRRSKIDGKRLTYVGENTRKAGTKAHASIQTLIDNPGITLEEFEALGGRRQDVLFDLKSAPESVQVEDGETAA